MATAGGAAQDDLTNELPRPKAKVVCVIWGRKMERGMAAGDGDVTSVDETMSVDQRKSVR